jgi:alpha-L-rhamnosidase
MSEAMQVVHPVCEYRVNPLGIDVLHPRLSWQLQSERRGARQTAYQVLAASSPGILERGTGDLWDTGKVLSDQSVHVVYAGQPLISGQRVWWKVRVWDEADEMSDYGPTVWWEMGLLHRHEWQAQWIGAALVGGPRSTVPCPFLRKPFILAGKIGRARLYVTALGLYEIYLNGMRVGEDIFTPGWTDYRKRVQYQVYDVAALLRSGDNAIGAILGDGWYCGHIGWLPRQFYGDSPRLLAQLVVTFEDDSTALIASDSTWKTAFGPLLEADLIMGESYDARREFGPWATPGFDDSAWHPVETFPDPGIALVATRSQAVRRIQEIQPVADPKPFQMHPGTHWVFDLGQNMVGRVRLRVSGPRGTTIMIRHAEMLNPDGTLYTDNLRLARQTDCYTLRGDGEEIFEPRFTFHGFRYVDVIGYPGLPDRNAITGVVLHSDLPVTGSFECSDPLVNQLQHNIVWGQKGNFLEVPTDCPQRDERAGWTGDAQVFIRTGAFNMNVAAFFTKWQQDLADGQGEAGYFPHVAPDFRGGDSGPAWADAGIICPWTIYVCYGDERLLAEHYSSLRRFVEYLIKTCPNLIRCDPRADPKCGHGDWLSVNSETPNDLIGTAFFAYSAQLLSRIAGVTGQKEDAERYGQLYEDIRRAFNQRFVTAEGLIVAHSQTAYVLALHFDLLPENLRPAAVEALVQDIERRKMHLSTGFVGTPYLLHVLSRFGRSDIAYQLLHQETYPSWLYPVTQGATTIWERWDGWRHDKGFQDPNMNSFNHYAYGAVGDWLYRVVGGIDALEPGYKHILLRPCPGGKLTHASASLDTLYGRVESRWCIQERRFDWEVAVPPNTRATAYLPASLTSQITEGGQRLDRVDAITEIRETGGEVIVQIAPGRYHFQVERR